MKKYTLLFVTIGLILIASCLYAVHKMYQDHKIIQTLRTGLQAMQTDIDSLKKTECLDDAKQACFTGFEVQAINAVIKYSQLIQPKK